VLTKPNPRGLAAVRKKFKRIVRSVVSHLWHPKGMTCLECGFLAFGDCEVIGDDRRDLSVRGVAGCPPLQDIQCFKKLWGRDVIDADGIFSEIEKRRRPCKGFFPYRPGYSPPEHRGLQERKLEKKQDRLEKITIGILSALAGYTLPLLKGWLRKYLGH